MSQNHASSLNALAELAAIRDYVMDVQRQLKAGQMPNMDSLEERTGDLCRIIREASSDIQRQCAPELKDLAQQLDYCEHELRSFYQTLTDASDRQQ